MNTIEGRVMKYIDSEELMDMIERRVEETKSAGMSASFTAKDFAKRRKRS